MRLLIALFFLNVLQPAYSRTISIASNIDQINGKLAQYAGIKPGDTLVLAAGNRGAIQFMNLVGKPKHPIIITNGDGVCAISTASCAYGISLRFCHYVRLCGKSSSDIKYGIKVEAVEHDGAGLGISDQTDNIEISGLEITNTKGPGILCKTNPDCMVNQSNSKQYNISIHHNYVHHTGTEGMYIGSTAYEGLEVKCDSAMMRILPPVLMNVLVFANRVEYTGWDGIQISLAQKVDCYDNNIAHDSQKQEPWQNSGLMIGGGATGKFHDNNITCGKGDGINCLGNGKLEIYGNHIDMDSASNKLAIYVNDKLADKNTHYTISNNQIKCISVPAIKMVNNKRVKADDLKFNQITPAINNKNIVYEGLKPAIK